MAGSDPQGLFGFNIGFALVALATLGLPSLFVGVLLYLTSSWWANPVVLLLLKLNSKTVLFSSLVALSFPSLLLVAITLSNMHPGMGPAIAYGLMFYMGTSIFWLPILLFWSWCLQRIVQREAGLA
ncbi:hypothetical protein [Motilimonas sp. KMU-193]|uniref:hypothetical protein n=1 Tax=Motilimonas sp. KMU-193 TaxID=3388668 RepID=UPI00396B2B69